MAMTNAERQAKWREKLKTQAAGGQKFEDALRAKMRAIILELLDDYEAEDDAWHLYNAGYEAISSWSDEELNEWLFDHIVNLVEAKGRQALKQKNAGNKSAKTSVRRTSKMASAR
jgi:hypothetical protein